jgi:gliding motility-associated-like protein
VRANDIAICPNEPAILLATGEPAGGVFQWFATPTSAQVLFTGQQFIPANITTDTTFYVQYILEKCVSARIPVSIDVLPLPVAQIASVPEPAERQFLPKATVALINFTQPQDVRYRWYQTTDLNEFGTLFDTTANPIVTFTDFGTYYFRLVARQGRCEDTTLIGPYTVRDSRYFLVPNAFTPNGDNLNDLFEFTARGVAQLTVQIYDRWGRLVYDYVGLNPAWNGRDKEGNDLPEGVYVYKINALLVDGLEIKDDAGTVSLIR